MLTHWSYVFLALTHQCQTDLNCCHGAYWGWLQGSLLELIHITRSWRLGDASDQSIISHNIDLIHRWHAIILHTIVTINSLAPGRCGSNFKYVLSKHMLQIKFMSTCEIAVRWMPKNAFDDKATLVQVMARCHQATSHNQNQCWFCSVTPYCTTRPRWVNKDCAKCSVSQNGLYVLTCC